MIQIDSYGLCLYLYTGNIAHTHNNELLAGIYLPLRFVRLTVQKKKTCCLLYYQIQLYFI